MEAAEVRVGGWVPWVNVDSPLRGPTHTVDELTGVSGTSA